MSTQDNTLKLPEFKIEKAGNRRRSRTQAVSDGDLISRSTRIAKRNIILTARYYYWTEIQRRRFDDVLHILSDNEFFVDTRTISNVLVEQSEYLTELVKKKVSKQKLKKLYPGFCWE